MAAIVIIEKHFSMLLKCEKWEKGEGYVPPSVYSMKDF